MATVTMPQLGESVTEGTILKWLKQPGEAVALDDPLCEIETEKVTAELPSPYEGVMGAILVPEGETALVDAPLCDVVEAGAPAGAASTAPASAAWQGGPMAIPPDEAPAATVSADRAAQPAPVRPRAAARELRERFYSPAVMHLAGEHSVDLAALQGTGIGGRVTRRDVERQIATGPAVAARAPRGTAAAGEAATGAPYEVVVITPTRRTIGENLKRSNMEAPQAWTLVEADVTGLVRRREREKEQARRDEGVDLTLLPYFTAAVCESLRAFSMLNARWENGELRRYHAVNVGVAVAAEHGLVVPVIHGAQELSVVGLAKRIADLAQRAHTRKLRLDDIAGGTFTVDNTGAFGSIASRPIVNYPQVAIVTMERAVKRPVVVQGDAIAVRWMMNVCLSFDHAALDGHEAGGFLADLKERLEAIG